MIVALNTPDILTNLFPDTYNDVCVSTGKNEFSGGIERDQWHEMGQKPLKYFLQPSRGNYFRKKLHLSILKVLQIGLKR